MVRVSFGRALLAGFLGWLALTLVMVMAPLMGVPPMSIPAMLGGMFGLNSVAFGWVAHLMIGLGLGLIYAYWVQPHLGGAGWVRGLVYSLLPWLVMMVIVAPMLPLVDPMVAAHPVGLFFADMGIMATMGTLIAHLVYGTVLGAVYGVPQASLTPART